MYWWNAAKLAEDFREGRVDEKERFKYYLATFVGLNVVAWLFLNVSSSFTTANLISALASLATTVIGITLCYRINKRGDNSDFIARMICLGWPASVSIAAAFLGLFTILACLESLPSAAFGPEAYRSAIAEEFLELWGRFYGILFIAPYYWVIYASLILVAQEKGVETRDLMGRTNWTMGKMAIGILVGLGVVVMTIVLFAWVPSLVGDGVIAQILPALPLGLLALILIGSTVVRTLRLLPKRPS
ncbi:MAG: hypothetical protein AB1473_23840 [Thermodesulfobacteriota bacterium]